MCTIDRSLGVPPSRGSSGDKYGECTVKLSCIHQTGVPGSRTSRTRRIGRRAKFGRPRGCRTWQRTAGYTCLPTQNTTRIPLHGTHPRLAITEHHMLTIVCRQLYTEQKVLRSHWKGLRLQNDVHTKRSANTKVLCERGVSAEPLLSSALRWETFNIACGY